MNHRFDIYSTLQMYKPRTTDAQRENILHWPKIHSAPKFLGTAEAYFVCHISPNFQIS